MEKAVYFILTLCGILSQGICFVSKENRENASDLLIRQKRLVGGSQRRILSTPYLVSVLENGNEHCPATLLTTDIAISSAACFLNRNIRNMRILSHSIAGGKQHQILRVIFMQPNYNPAHPTVNNLALVIFASPILFHASDNRPVPIYSGFLAADHSTSRVVNWGKPLDVGGRRIASDHIETFATLLLSFQYCQHMYPNIVRKGNICTSGTNAGEYCETDRDTGAALIKDNKLLGIFVYHGCSRQTNPDVYMNLLDNDIRRWIHQHVPSLRLF